MTRPNGYTVKAQATFVGAAQRNGHTLVVVLLKTHPRYWPEAAALLDWGFAAEAAHTQPVGELITAHSDATGQHPQTPTGTDTARTAAPRHPTNSTGLLTSALGASALLIVAALIGGAATSSAHGGPPGPPATSSADTTPTASCSPGAGPGPVPGR